MSNPPSARVERLWAELGSLSMEELMWLRYKFSGQYPDDEEEGGIGVREPRKPNPESPGDAIALEV